MKGGWELSVVFMFGYPGEIIFFWGTKKIEYRDVGFLFVENL